MTTTFKPQADRSTSLLAQADLVLILVDALRLPAPQAIQSALAWTPPDQLRQLVADARLEPGDELGTAICELAQAWRDTDDQSRLDEHHRLFEASMVCPLCEASYIRRDKGAILGDVAGFYKAFGWQWNPDTAERPDHLICELEFIAILLTMTFEAQRNGDATAEHVTQNAMARFVEAHLNDWLTALTLRLRHTTCLGAYAQLAHALDRLWNAMVHTHHWPMPSNPDAMAPISEPEFPYECLGNTLPSPQHAMLSIDGRTITPTPSQPQQ